YSDVLFRHDEVGYLFFNGVASRVDRQIYANGLEVDMSYKLNDQNTLRGGLLFTASHATVGSATLVFPVDAIGNQTSDVPFRIVDNSSLNGYFAGFYLQDEWKLFEQLTINFGGRIDIAKTIKTESQFSPRINIVYTPWTTTTFHAGYARYFTPPPLENVDQSTIAKFTGTTNESAITLDSPVKAERAHYFDAGVHRRSETVCSLVSMVSTNTPAMFWMKDSSGKHSFFRPLITEKVKFTAGNSPLTTSMAGSPVTLTSVTNMRAECMSVPRSSCLIPTSLPTFEITGSSSITISGSPAPPESLIAGMTGVFPRTHFMGMGCAAALPTRKRIIPTKL